MSYLIGKGPQLNATCNACKLHSVASRRSICLAPKWGERRGLIVYVDFPDFFADKLHKPFIDEVGGFLDWNFKSMSVDPKRITYDYTLRCYPNQALPKQKAYRMACIHECNTYRFDVISKLAPRAIVALGAVSAEAFISVSKISECAGRAITAKEPVVREKVEKIWIASSIQAVLRNASEAPEIFRVLFKAAEEAKLNPKIDSSIPPFIWQMR